MSSEPLVSVIIPCRNEERFIAKCLDSIIDNVYPKDKMEILIIDGASNDNTREIIEAYKAKYPFIKLLSNPRKITPAALNIGIKNAQGDVIIRMDSHATYEGDYVSKCIKYLDEYKADNVGGIWKTTAANDSFIARGIALALSHPFGIGNSYFRIGLKEPKIVDTVPYGCYKRETFDKIGLFNEGLIRNQDIELNLRLRRSGGKIILFPDIVSYYYARPNLSSLFKQNFQNGLWVIYSTKFAKLPFSWRHLVPFAFVTSILCSLFLSFFLGPFLYLFVSILGVYATANIFFGFKIALKNGLNLFPAVIAAFATLHISYGLGSLCGIFKLITNPRKKSDF